MISVQIEPVYQLSEDEFWRDVEATNRCDDPKRARQFLSSLVVRRARWEATQRRLMQSEVQGFIDSRARILWSQCRAMGFHAVSIFGMVPTFTLNLTKDESGT